MSPFMIGLLSGVYLVIGIGIAALHRRYITFVEENRAETFVVLFFWPIAVAILLLIAPFGGLLGLVDLLAKKLPPP